jgi:glycerophosphodiester phosphodiesterase
LLARQGFDIEIKLATPDDMAVTPPSEVERMVDNILGAVEVAEARDEGQGKRKRPLLFSSFDPDVCDLVKRRRPFDCVMFLSTGGTSYHADRRRMSIDAAIEVAVLCGLQGVILDSGALWSDQGAVTRAKAKGMAVMTYGQENDDVAWVEGQRRLGVHGVIVDDVEKMRAAFLGG